MHAVTDQQRARLTEAASLVSDVLDDLPAEATLQVISLLTAALNEIRLGSRYLEVDK